MNSPILTREEAAPLLTAEMLDDVDGLSQLLDPCEESNGELQRALQALADGRTACVRVMSEDECRAEFDKSYDGFRLLPSSANYRENCLLVWLACARANGLVSGEKK